MKPENLNANAGRILDYDNDQDLIALYNMPLAIKKKIHALQGIAMAVIYDGMVDNKEIDMMVSWLAGNEEIQNIWPVSHLTKLLYDILEDKIITSEERQDLFKFLNHIACNPEAEPIIGGIFTPNPIIIFKNKSFLFTGILQSGTRKKAQTEVIRRGGQCPGGGYKLSIDYLVAGDLGQDAWKFNRFGTKIQNCMEALNAKKAKTAIIREVDFVRAIITVPL